MAGKPVIGKLAVKVFPDLSDFKAQLKAELERINPKLEVKVDLKVDDTKFKAETIAATKEAAAAASQVAHVDLKADLDTKKAFAESQALAKSIQRNVKLPIVPTLQKTHLDVDKFIATQFGTPEIKFKFGIDHVSLEKTKLELKFAAKEAAVTVPVKTDKKSFSSFISGAAGLGAKAASAIGNAIGETASQVWDAFVNEGQEAFGKLNSQVSKFGSYLSNVQQIASLLGVSLLVVFGGALISAAIGAITLAVGGLETALLGLPGAISVVATGAGALLISLNGVQDALVAGWKGSKGYQDALKKLAPAAQTAVTSLVSLKGSVKGMGKEIQQSFFEGFAGDLKDLGTSYLPLVRTGLDNMAKSLGKAVGKFTKWAGTQDALERTESIFDQTSRVIDHLSGTVDPLADAFSRLTDDALPFLQKGADYATKLAKQFDKWVKSAEDSGELTDMFTNLGKLIDGIVEPVTRLASGIAKVFAQKESGTALDDMKDSLDQIIDNVLPYLPGFIEDFDKIVKAVATLSDYTGPLAQVMHWLTDIAQWTIGEYWGASIILIYEMGKSIADLIDNFQHLPDAFANLYTASTVIGNTLIKKMWDGIGQQLSIFAGLGKIVWKAINNGLGGLPNKLLTFSLTLPQKMWDGIKQNLSMASTGGTAIKDAVIKGVKSLPSLLLTIGLGIPTKIASGIRNKLGQARNAANSIRNAVINGIGYLGSVLYNAGQQVISGLISGIRSMIPGLGSVLGGIGGFIVDHKGPPAKDKVLLYNNGRLIMQGLINGMESQYGLVETSLSGLTGMITGSGSSVTADVLHEVQGSIDSRPIEVTLVADGQKLAKVVATGKKKNDRR